jgi:TRAP-type mannitol/chloroaromatic compound transport system substrate-binding protein
MPVWGEGVNRFVNNLKLLTAGQFVIKVYGAGELIPALETFSAVKSGQIQMGHSASYYWLGKVPAASFFCAVPFGMSSECLQAWVTQGDGQSLWDELMHPHGVTCFLLGSTGHQMTGWFNKEIKSPEDLKGLKIRIPGVASRVYARAGAVPMLIPGGEVFTSLSTGVIDAVEWIGPYNDYLMGLHRAARFYYAGSWHEPGPFLELMINKSAWDALSNDFKFALKAAASEACTWMKTAWDTRNSQYLKKMREEGVNLREFPTSVLKILKKHSEAELEKIAAGSDLAARIYSSYRDFMLSFEDYTKISTAGFHQAKWG